MIAGITITNVGAHESRTVVLAPGRNDVRAPSRAGKSTIMDAVSLALHGTDRLGAAFPVSLIRDGADAAEAEVLFADGSSVRRKMLAGRSWVRIFRPATGDPIFCSTDEAMAKALGPLADAVACRLIMFPMTWDNLGDTDADNAKKLRDLLERLLPGPSSADLLAQRLRPGEPSTEKDAMEHRKQAKRIAAEAEGARDEAKRALAAAIGTQVTGPTQEAVQEAHDAIDAYGRAVEALATAREAWATWKAAKQAHDAATASGAAWDVRAAGLNPPKVERPGADELARLLRAAQDASAKVAEIVSRGQSVRAELAALQDARPDHALLVAWMKATSAHEAAEQAVASSGPCRGVTEGACRLASGAQRARMDVEATRKALDAATEAKRADAEAVEQANATTARNRARKQEEIGEIETEYRKAKKDFDDAVIEGDDARERLAAWTNHDAGQAGLGERPAAAADPGAAPVVETPPEPFAARQVLAADRDALARREQVAIQVAGAQAALIRRETAATEGRAMANRAEEIVAAVRAAPGEALRGKLGPIAGLEIVVPEEGAIEIKIAGRDHRRASTGERIVADLSFRRSLRAVLGLELPIFVDEAQSVGLEWPEDDGQTVYLHTTGAGAVWSEVTP